MKNFLFKESPQVIKLFFSHSCSCTGQFPNEIFIPSIWTEFLRKRRDEKEEASEGLKFVASGRRNFQDGKEKRTFLLGPRRRKDGQDNQDW